MVVFAALSDSTHSRSPECVQALLFTSAAAKMRSRGVPFRSEFLCQHS